MKLAQSFSYIFKDNSWFFKVFVGGLFLVLSFAVVGLPYVVGYQIELIRRMTENKEDVLPEWKSSRRLFKDGSTVLIAMVMYLVPIAALKVIAPETFSRLYFVLALILVLFFWIPLVLIQYAKRATFLSCFSLLEILSRPAQHPALFIASLTLSCLVIAGTVLLGWMSLIVGWPFVVFWGIVVQSHILGQLARL